MYDDHHIVKTYRCDSNRGTGFEKVICILLTSPDDLLEKQDNSILTVLADSGMSRATGLYFYRFAFPVDNFIKIGETTRPGGIEKRFRAGWHAKGTDIRCPGFCNGL